MVVIKMGTTDKGRHHAEGWKNISGNCGGKGGQDCDQNGYIRLRKTSCRRMEECKWKLWREGRAGLLEELGAR
jgi:hypothetical protein